MYISMALKTNRFNVKPVLWFIAGMMILFCLLRTVSTFEFSRWLYFSCFNSASYCTVGFNCFRVILSIYSCSFSLRYSTFCTETITSLADYVFFSLSVSALYQLFKDYTFFAFVTFLLGFFVAQLALVMKSIFAAVTFVKFREGFELFTHTTCFSLIWHYCNYTASIMKYKG